MKKNPDVADVVLFGSSVRNKIMPKDVDLCCVLFEENKKRHFKIMQDLETLLKSIGKIHVSILSMKTFPKESLWKPLIHEGYSLYRKKWIHEMLGYDSMA